MDIVDCIGYGLVLVGVFLGIMCIFVRNNAVRSWFAFMSVGCIASGFYLLK